jgi:transposase
MLSPSQRTAILELHAQGISKREIARILNVSRLSVRKVLRSKSAAVPELHRSEKAEAYRDQILEQLALCKGNLVRVHEELLARGASISYPALTAFCRRHSIGQTPKVPAGQYHFEPGDEIQHDTSPHEAEIAGKKRKIQSASAVLCYSRTIFFQGYPRFQRFDCKVFLTDALRYFGGSSRTVMIDNTHVVVLRGTGASMIPVPEMEAFGERFGFRFAAHELGDANRSARVERPFDFIENNFFAGRTFSSWEDLNQQARQWCDRVNGTYKKHIRAVPRELFAIERLHLKPLPAWIPEVYRVHERIVDVDGYVALHSSRYSVPADWIGRRVEVRETKNKIELQLDPRHIVTHQRVPEGEFQRVTLAEHRPSRGERIRPSGPHPDEQTILQTAPELAGYLAALKKRGHRSWTIVLRQLLRLIRDYPRPPVVAAVEEAARYGLYDLDRLERMILRRIAHDYFLLDEWKGSPDEDE